MNKSKEFNAFKRKSPSKKFARAIWSGMDLPESWNYINIGEIAEIQGGYGFSSDNFGKEYSEDGTPLIKRKTVNNSDYPEQYTVEDFDEKYEVNTGDVLVSMDGHFNSYMWPYQETAALNQRVCKLSPSSNIITNKYLYYILKPLLNHTQKSLGATTVKSLSMKDFNFMEPAIPPISEQERIASVLYSVDKKLEQLHARKEKHEKLKQGLMQDLLTGEKDVWNEIKVIEKVTSEPSDIIDKDWENVKLSDLFDTYKAGGTPKTSNDDYYSDKDTINKNNLYHFLKIDSITDNKYISEGSEIITEQGLSESTARLYDKNDLVLSIYGSYGKVGILSTEVAISQAMIGIKPNKNKVNTEYLYYLLDSLDSTYDSLASGTTQQNLSKSLISLIDVNIPPLWEQERIASVLYIVDEIINNTDNLIEKNERLKQGLMQDLLSGKIRTPKELDSLEEVIES